MATLAGSKCRLQAFPMHHIQILHHSQAILTLLWFVPQTHATMHQMVCLLLIVHIVHPFPAAPFATRSLPVRSLSYGDN